MNRNICENRLIYQEKQPAPETQEKIPKTELSEDFAQSEKIFTLVTGKDSKNTFENYQTNPYIKDINTFFNGIQKKIEYPTRHLEIQKVDITGSKLILSYRGFPSQNDGTKELSDKVELDVESKTVKGIFHGRESFLEELTKSKQALEDVSEDAAKETDQAPKNPEAEAFDKALEENEQLANQENSELYKSYIENVKKIDPETAQQDFEKLQDASIEDIRYNTRYLKTKEKDEKEIDTANSLKEETARRIKAYTTNWNGETQFDGKWYTLNYQRVGGSKHEYGIGLGDILLDPDIQEILVQKDGYTIKAKRGVVQQGKHKGRQGFIDQYGDYLATLTGDKFKILSASATDFNDSTALKGYLDKYNNETAQRKEHQKLYREYKEKFGSPYETFSQNDIDKYSKKHEAIESKLNPSDVSKIPYTERVSEIPEKEPGSYRLVVFGDTNGSYGSEGQKYLDQLKGKIPDWNADALVCVGDVIASGPGLKSKLGDKAHEKHEELSKKAAQEFEQLLGDTNLPMMLALGNHDVLDSKSNSELQKQLFDKFNYKSNPDGSAYSYQLGNATFIVFNTGSGSISQNQKQFFKKSSVNAPGAVYLVNHVPPFQTSHGAGHKEDGSSYLKGFDEIQQFAKENIENNGKPFYVLSGHDHFHSVIGNFINPGGMGSSYWGLPGNKLRSVPSAAVIDMDANGKITNVYFRSAKSGFEDPLPKMQHALAWNKTEMLEDLTPDNNTEMYTKGIMPLYIDENKSVVEQIKIPLNGTQLKHAKIIEEEFTKEGIPKPIIAAAIVNAHSESRLKNVQSGCKNKKGEREESYGLFQINIKARKYKVSAQEMLDPRKNCKEILKSVKSKHWGKRLWAAYNSGASVSELAGIFCKDIERPAGGHQSAQKRAEKASNFFHPGPVPEKLASGEKLGKYNKDQIQIFGASYTVGLKKYHLVENGIPQENIYANGGKSANHIASKIESGIKDGTKLVIPYIGVANTVGPNLKEKKGVYTQNRINKAFNKIVKAHERILAAASKKGAEVAFTISKIPHGWINKTAKTKVEQKRLVALYKKVNQWKIAQLNANRIPDVINFDEYSFGSFAGDGLHFGKNGYKKMGAALFKEIEQIA